MVSRLCLLVGMWLGLACGLGAAEAPLAVAVTILPQKFLVEQVGGARVAVTVLVPAGAAAETYQVSPRRLAELGRARLYFKVGFGMEDVFLPRLQANFPQVKVVDSAAGIKKRRLESHAHDGVPCAGHNSPDDPHVWVSLRLAKRQAENICRALAEADPACRGFYEQNLQALQARLDEADAYVAAKLAPYKGSAFFCYHPGFGYFADDYGLEQVAMELNGQKPSLKQMGHFIAEARRENIRMIFVQSQFSTESAEALAKQIGAKVVPVDNLSENYLVAIRDMADKIAAALAPVPAAASK